MNLTIVLEGLQQDLQGLSELGDERSARIAQRLGEALASNLRLKLFDLLAQVAVELSSSCPPVTSRFASRDRSPSSCSSTTRASPRASPAKSSRRGSACACPNP